MSVSTFNTAVCACLSPYTTEITGSKEEKKKEEKEGEEEEEEEKGIF